MLDIWYSLSSPSLQTCLSEEEQLRQARFVFAKHRASFAQAHTLKRLVLSFYEPTIQPSEWQFEKGPHGKPAVKQPYPYRFNLSHSESSIAIAIAKTEIGVDIELCRPLPHLESLVETVFHPLEQRWLWRQASIERSFFRLWTIKEAVLKATGAGLSQAPNQFLCEGLEGEPMVTASLAGTTWCCISRQVGDYALSFAVPVESCLADVRHLQVGVALPPPSPLNSPLPAVSELLRCVDIVDQGFRGSQ